MVRRKARVDDLFWAPGAHLLEDWSIVADMPLDELLIGLNLDPQLIAGRRNSRDGRVHPVDVVGAEIVPGTAPTPQNGRRLIALRLPRPLGPQESHTFQLRASVSGADRIGHHLCQPPVRCRRLHVRVHFDRTSVPARARAVPGDHARVPRPEQHPELTINAVGEVEMSFEHPVLGQAYGIAWSQPEDWSPPEDAATAARVPGPPQ